MKLRYENTLNSGSELCDSVSWDKAVLLEPVTSNYYTNSSERKKSTYYFYCSRVTLREHHVHMKCQIKDVHQLCYIGFIPVTRNINSDFENSFIFVVPVTQKCFFLTVNYPPLIFVNANSTQDFIIPFLHLKPAILILLNHILYIMKLTIQSEL
jgi:hypothetical protein